jgi:hypothetical protein
MAQVLLDLFPNIGLNPTKCMIQPTTFLVHNFLLVVELEQTRSRRYALGNV